VGRQVPSGTRGGASGGDTVKAPQNGLDLKITSSACLIPTLPPIFPVIFQILSREAQLTARHPPQTTRYVGPLFGCIRHCDNGGSSILKGRWIRGVSVKSPVGRGAVLLVGSSASVVCCRLSSSVTLPAFGWAGRRPGAREVVRPTLHGGPVVLRPVRATPCFHPQSSALLLVCGES